MFSKYFLLQVCVLYSVYIIQVHLLLELIILQCEVNLFVMVDLSKKGHLNKKVNVLKTS